MRHQSKYRIPKPEDLNLPEVVRAEYGYKLHDAPSGYYCKCPFHNHTTPGPRGSLRIYADNPIRGGYVCPAGAQGSLWDFLEESLGLPGPDDPGFDETLEYAAELLNLELELKDGFEITAQDRAYELMRDLKEALQPIEFSAPNNHYYKDEDGRWVYRGIDPMTWLNYGVGMLGDVQLYDLTSSYSDQVFEAAGISKWPSKGYQWMTEGVIAIRPAYTGAPLGFAVRRYAALAGESSIDAKYLKNNRKSQILDTSSYVFGMDSLRRSDHPEVYIVEGEFDALALRVRGLPNVVTCGAGHPSGGQLETLYETGRHLVFVPDVDDNEAGFRHAASVAKEVPEAQFIFLPGEDMDPDDYAQEIGAHELPKENRYTAMQVRMLAEDAYNEETDDWAEGVADSLVRKYMNEIIEHPDPFDEDDVEMIAYLARRDPDYLKSVLFTERNLDAAAMTDQPLRLAS